MSQAENLLRSIAAYPTNDTTVSSSPVNDYLIIDAEARIINVPATETLFGVETDANSERKYFKCPRIVGDNIDLTKLDLRIHYRNTIGEDDGYIVTDVKVEDEFITFSWKLEGKLFKSKGTIYFAVCAVEVDSNGVETCKWNTTLATGNVLEGLRLDLTETEETEARSILQQLLNIFNTKSEETVQAVVNEGIKQVGNVKTTGAEQRTLIESKGAETLATIPEDYTSTYNAADEAIRTKAKAILLEEEGEVISVSDASDDHVRGLKVFGKSEQAATTGKNLWDNKTSTFGHSELFSRTDTGFLVKRGTITGGSYVSYEISISKGQTLTFSAKGSAYTPILYLYKDQVYGTALVAGESGKFTYTADADVEKAIFAIIINSAHGDCDISEIQIEEGTVATEYEPYTGGKPAPNPEYPQELVSLGDNEGLEASIYGKNLINQPNVEFVAYKMHMVNLPAGNYTISATVESADTDGSESLVEIKLANNSYMYGRLERNKRDSFTFTATSPIVQICIYASVDYKTSQNDVATWYDTQLERGSVATDYEPYNEQTITIPRALPGIPVSSGGNYTDSDGQQWICDEVDFERGVYVKRVSKNVITSDMQVTLKTDRDDCNQIAFELLKYDDTVFVSRSVPGLCNKFKRGSYTVGCFDIGTVADSGWGGKSRITFYVDKSITTVEAFMEYIGDDCVVLTPLATPIETPLTADELNTFRALHTNYPNTVVINDSGATMKFLYNADTRSHIQNGHDILAEEVNSVKRYLNDGGKKPGRAMISFTDDDCRVETYTRLFPLIKELNIPYAIACPPGSIGDSGYMNISQLKDMYKHGVDVTCHHWRQYNMDNPTQFPNAETYDEDLAKCDSLFKELGIPVNTVSYPQGRYVYDYINTVKKHYRMGFTVERGINQIPYESYFMKRCELFPTTGNFTLSTAKALVDQVMAEGGWLVFMTHAWYDTFSEADLRALVQYIRSKSVDIVSLNEAIETTGNIVDVGLFKKPLEERSSSFFVVDANGDVWTNSMNLIQKSEYEYQTLNLQWAPGYALMPSGGKRLYTLSDGTTPDPNRRISTDITVQAGEVYLISGSAVWNGAVYVVRNSDDTVNDILNDDTNSASGTVVTDRLVEIKGDAVKMIVSTNLTIQPGGFVVKKRV